ncbi:MAG: T9SS type A sorting domain-containing protein [Cytophagaceae bacterium]
MSKSLQNLRLLLLALIIFASGKSKALTIKDSTVFGKPVYVVDWKDHLGKPRKAAIVKDNFQASTGVIVYIRYYDGNTPVNITSPTPYDDVNNGKPWNVGFGCTVHHGSPSDGAYHNGGSLTLTYQGTHHAVFTWIQTLDGAVETVVYTFMDGLDYFQWQETVDGRAGTKFADSRGPYCTMQWDGIDFSAVDGQEYGAEKYFSQPTYNGPWTLNGTCDIPFVRQWDNNREVGYVQTQTFTQQLAGVPNWSGSWNLPASGSSVQDADVWKFDYQMNFYDKAKKITWGMPLGYMQGSASAGGKNGWGQYSLSIIFDNKTDNGVMRLRDENRIIHNGNVALSATKGSIVTSGPVGTANPATQTLSPAGFDHNYRTWWIQANAGGEAEVTLNVNSGSLKHPTFRIKSMNGAPTSVKLNGTTLLSNVDYYASFNSSTGEVWLTLLKNVSGTNSLNVVSVNTGIVVSSFSVTPESVINNVTNYLTFEAEASDNGNLTSVKLDLSSIGGGSSVNMNTSGGNTYTLEYTLPVGASTGSKAIHLTVTDNDGFTASQTIYLNINPSIEYLNIYTDASSIVNGTWNSNGTLSEQNGTSAFEGSKDYLFNFNVAAWYAGFGLNISNWSDANAKNFSGFPTLEISYSGPTTTGAGIGITLAGPGSTQSSLKNLPATASYTTVAIPLTDFGNFDLTKITGINIGITGIETGTGTLRIDNIRLSRPVVVSSSTFSTNTGSSLSGEELSIYPNPMNGQCYLNLKSETGTIEVLIRNELGILIKQLQISSDNSSNILIDLKDQHDGVYFTEIRTVKESKIIKLIKQ